MFTSKSATRPYFYKAPLPLCVAANTHAGAYMTMVVRSCSWKGMMRLRVGWQSKFLMNKNNKMEPMYVRT